MRKFSKHGLIALLLVGAGAACTERKPAEFAPYAHAAYESARAAKRPIVILATAEWCPPCKKLKSGALSDPAVRAALEPFARFVVDGTNYKTDRSINAQLVAFKVDSFPTLIFVDPHGAELPYLKGNQTPETIIATAKKAAEG